MVKWLYDHYILTSLIVIWALTLITVVTIKTFFSPVAIPTATAAALATVYALPSLAIGLFKWRASKMSDKQDDE